jgi:hypothetical protein
MKKGRVGELRRQQGTQARVRQIESNITGQPFLHSLSHLLPLWSV